MLVRSLILKASAMGPIERMVRRSRLFRSVVKRFIAGDTLEEALKAADELLKRGFLVSLDYLGENTKTEAEAVASTQTFVRMLEAIDRMPNAKAKPLASFGIPAPASQGRAALAAGPPSHLLAEPLNISIKLTQCGFDLGDAFAESQYSEVVRTARDKGNFVRADMESSHYTQRTLDMVERVWRELEHTGTVLQSYLIRTDADVDRMIELGMRVRLVKGAYLEPPSIAFADKKHVDEAFLNQAKRLVERAVYPAIATHDERIIRALNAYCDANGIPKARFEYQMLYGIRRDLQDSLLASGYNVRVYVPFGEQWYPYFSRRLAERPANVFFILRALIKG